MSFFGKDRIGNETFTEYLTRTNDNNRNQVNVNTNEPEIGEMLANPKDNQPADKVLQFFEKEYNDAYNDLTDEVDKKSLQYYKLVIEKQYKAEMEKNEIYFNKRLQEAKEYSTTEEEYEASRKKIEKEKKQMNKYETKMFKESFKYRIKETKTGEHRKRVEKLNPNYSSYMKEMDVEKAAANYEPLSLSDALEGRRFYII